MPEDPSSFIRFSLTVRSDLAATARAVLVRECESANPSILTEFVPSHDEARLWVTLPAAVYSTAIHALIGELPAAEFGSAVQWSPSDVKQAA